MLAVTNVSFCLAAPPPEQEISGQERMREMQEAEKALREKIERKQEIPLIEEKIPGCLCFHYSRRSLFFRFGGFFFLGINQSSLALSEVLAIFQLVG